MALQQSLKAVKLYLKLVAVRMVSLQFIVKIDFRQSDNISMQDMQKTQLISKTKIKSSYSRTCRLKFTCIEIVLMVS